MINTIIWGLVTFVVVYVLINICKNYDHESQLQREKMRRIKGLPKNATDDQIWHG